MQPDAQLGMRAALALGPGHCPPDLFAGPVPAIVRGLKAHANTINHARHVALEDTFPRTRAQMGAEAFHEAAERHLADPVVVRLPLLHIGTGFARLLTGPERDLARVEWAWLESHGSAEAQPFDLAAIAGLDADAVASAVATRHPATRLVPLECPADFQWDAVRAGPLVLITRPVTEVTVTCVDEAVSDLIGLVDRPRSLGELLEHDPAATTVVITTGAIALFPEILL